MSTEVLNLERGLGPLARHSTSGPSFAVCCSLVTKLCLTLYDPMDCSWTGSSFRGIFQASIQEWVAISFSRRSSQPSNRIQSPALQADSLLSEPRGKPLNMEGNFHDHLQRLCIMCIPKTLRVPMSEILFFLRKMCK